MATSAKIGARIGIEGWQEYRDNIKLIIQQTKELDSENKNLTTTFDKQNTTIKKTTEYREYLNKQLKLSEAALKEQNTLMDSLKKAYEDEAISETQFNLRQSELQTNINNVKNEIANYKNELAELPNNFKIIGDEMKRVGEDIVNVGSSLTENVTKPLISFFRKGIEGAIGWESAFTGVKKTNKELVDDTGKIVYSFDDLEKELKQIGLVTGSTYDQIAAVGEISGQLGVGIDEVGEFSKVMIELGDSTNLSAEEAASAIATILNITGKGMPITAKEARKLGSAIVDLGNNYNTTESDITRMSARLAAGATLAGLTSADVVGLATAMSSVGINAEAGGTAMSQTLSKIQKEFAAFSDGAESNLPRIAEIAGMSATEFADAWSTRPNEAIVSFIKGLGELDMSSGETVLALDDLGMSGIRQANMLESLALASKILESAMTDSNKAFEDGNALAYEAEQRYGDTAVQLQQLKNDFELLMIDVGELLLPTLRDMVDFGKQLIDWARNLSPETKKLIVNFLELAVTVGPLVKLFGNVVIGAGNLVSAFSVLSGKGGFGLLNSGLQAATKGTAELIGGGASGLTGVIGTLAKFGGVALGGSLAFWGFKEALTTSKEEAEKLQSSWDDVSQNLINKWQNTSSAGIGAFNEMEKGIGSANELAKENIFKKWNETGNQLETTIKETRRNVTVEFDGMGGQLSRTMETTKNDLTTKTSNLKTSVYNDFNVIENDMINSIKNAKRGIEIEAPNVTNTIHKMVNTGVDEIRLLPNKMYSYGADMMSNLRRGISSGISSVVDKVSSLAGTIRAYLHFSEPDVGPLSNFNSWMPDMMKQMAQGINDNSYLVEGAIDNIANKMAIGSNANSFNYGGVVINLNVPEGANGSMIVDEIETELANRTMRRRAVFN